MLRIIEQLPPGLLDCEAHQLHTVLSGPTLVHLPGRDPRALFVSVLLHGNEDTGWLAARDLLRHYADRPLPRSLSLLIGNVRAARYGMRRLDDQPDFNRVWSGGDTPEHAMASQVQEEMGRRPLFASVDIHNNTGFNPHYACVNRLDHRFFHLAALFGRTVVYFIRPDTVQSLAFARMCPAVTLECGQPGQPHGVDHALQYLQACLHLSEIPVHRVPSHDIDLFHTVAVVKVPPGVSFGFDGEEQHIRFVPELDHLNFRELPEGTTLGWLAPSSAVPLDVSDEQGREVGDRYFAVRNGELQTRVPVMPSMLTLNSRVIRQDCLCYLMERYPVAEL
jgi:hypothetical protein